MSTSRTRYSLALASAATLATLSCGAFASAASADPGDGPHPGGQGKHLGQDKHDEKAGKDKPGKGDPGTDEPGTDRNGQGDNGKHLGQGKGQGHGKDEDTDKGQGGGQGQANGHAHAPGQQKQDKGPKGQGEQGDPPGNNGTVKIAAPSDAVGHPSNNPHPGCTVVVEWFGYDAGDDVTSTVTFAPQAPTSDVTIGGTSPSSVFVGGDAASGGTDLDGRQAYTLTFDGAPHPKQGYHVKLTVATPRSLGNDTKTKVFWVEPCASSGETETESGTSTDETEGQGASSQSTSAPGQDQGVLGTSATAESEAAATAAEDAGAAVPTAVDAGEDGSVMGDWARSPWPLVAVAGGLALAGAAIARRARNGA